ncbi:MAG: C39 family peptidase [Kiloniellales bacterium]|nr:C39 family peptidase [Kiloniellales bacterium]
MKSSRAFLYTLVAVALCTALVPGSGAKAGSVSIESTGGSFNVKVASVREARFKNVVKQQYDFSCGAAAVATVMTYHYERPIEEAEVFSAMFEAGDKEKIQQVGFSLLDMKNYLETQGYRANGYEVPLDKLVEAQIPGIALINTRGYMHFVVVKGVTADHVLVADPAMGNRVYPREDFEAMWNGIVFVILDDDEIAAAHFNQERDWRVRAKPPVDLVRRMRDESGYFSLTLPRQNYF